MAEVNSNEGRSSDCEEWRHDWRDVYYGWECNRCGLFFPHGGAPWDEPPDGDEGFRDDRVLY